MRDTYKSLMLFKSYVQRKCPDG